MLVFVLGPVVVFLPLGTTKHYHLVCLICSRVTYVLLFLLNCLCFALRVPFPSVCVHKCITMFYASFNCKSSPKHFEKYKYC